MIKTVIFDIGDTLTHFTWQEHIRSFGYDDEICRRVGKATVESSHWKQYDIGVMSNDEIVNLFVELDKGVEKEIRESMSDFKGLVKPADYAIPWIKSLKEDGLQVLFLSNFSEKAFTECQDALDFLSYMDGGIFSYRVGFIKPDPEIYELLLSTYGLDPKECIFIDDLDDNLKTASDLNINTLLFTGFDQTSEALKKVLKLTQ